MVASAFLSRKKAAYLRSTLFPYPKGKQECRLGSPLLDSEWLDSGWLDSGWLDSGWLDSGWLVRIHLPEQGQFGGSRRLECPSVKLASAKLNQQVPKIYGQDVFLGVLPKRFFKPKSKSVPMLP